MTLTIVLFSLVVCWVLFNWLAPLAVCVASERMSIGRIPGDILYQANAHKVRYYHAKLHRGYAFTVWCWPARIIVIDTEFLRNAHPEIIRFVLAHELGHIVLGHTFYKWLSVVTGLALIPQVRSYLKRQEESADEYAEKLSCVPRSILRGRVFP